MIIIKKIETEAGTIGICELNESLQNFMSVYPLSFSEKIEFSKIIAEKRKKEFLAIRIILKELLGFNPEIQYKKSGKPFLSGSMFKISVSHSAEMAVVILSEKNIGIDVENAERNIEKIASRFLHESEKAVISKNINRHRLQIIYWSAKEAIFKSSESEGIQFNSQILIHPFKIGENPFKGDLIIDQAHLKFNLYYLPFKNNVIVYAVEEVI